MPLNLPEVPDGERSVRNRIVAKFNQYDATYPQDVEHNTDAASGERYEIAVAIKLYEAGKLVHGNQLSRKKGVEEARQQHINVGTNTEYDFVISGRDEFPRFDQTVPHVEGRLLGEAKSYYGGRLNEYIRKAAGYCLHDPQSLCGFCFVTPGNRLTVWRQILTQVYGILSKPSDTPGICGGERWRYRESQAGKPRGQAIVDHFRQYQDPGLLQGRLHTHALEITRELITHAGFFVVVYQVDYLEHGNLANEIRKFN